MHMPCDPFQVAEGVEGALRPFSGSKRDADAYNTCSTVENPFVTLFGQQRGGGG